MRELLRSRLSETELIVGACQVTRGKTAMMCKLLTVKGKKYLASSGRYLAIALHAITHELLASIAGYITWRANILPQTAANYPITGCQKIPNPHHPLMYIASGFGPF